MSLLKHHHKHQSFLIHLIYLFKVIYDHVPILKYSSCPPFGLNKQREIMYEIRKVDECGNVVGEVIFFYQTIRSIKAIINYVNSEWHKHINHR